MAYVNPIYPAGTLIAAADLNYHRDNFSAWALHDHSDTAYGSAQMYLSYVISTRSNALARTGTYITLVPGSAGDYLIYHNGTTNNIANATHTHSAE